MIDMPVIAKPGLGLFDALNGWQSPKEFSEYLTTAATQDYGFAGPAFVRYLIDHRDSLDLRGRLATLSTVINDGDSLSAQESRVLRSFALIALAGELAIEAGIFPWDIGSVKSAAKKLFATWRAAQPQSATSREHVQILERIADFIARHCDTRFTDIKPSMHTDYTDRTNPVMVKDEKQEKAYNRAGYYEGIGTEKMYLFTKDGLRDATHGFDFGRVLRALDEAGAFYVTGSGGEKAKLRRLPGGGSTKLYHIDPEKLDAGLRT
jgi:putative DNA primase/helicase